MLNRNKVANNYCNIIQYYIITFRSFTSDPKFRTKLVFFFYVSNYIVMYKPQKNFCFF